MPEIRWKAVLLAVAVLVLAGMATLWITALSPFRSSPAPAAPALTTRIGEVRQVALADGSQLILDTDTRVLTAFTRERRWIELRRGRVRVVVARDKIRPFIVRVGNREIVTAGVMFDVSHRDGIDIHMLHGSVEIRDASHKAGPERLVLQTGERLLIPAAAGAVPIRSRAPDADRQWVDEIQGFRDVPVRDIIDRANAYGTEKIELADPATGSRRISGQINIRSPAAAAEAIAGHLGLAVDRSRPGRIVIGPAGR